MIQHSPDEGLPPLEELLALVMDPQVAPAMSAGVLLAERMALACVGSASLAPETPVSRDTLFEIGSITKVWTATAVMRLVERGALALDTTVRDVLPDFRLAGGAGGDITIRHLLSHTSGIQEDPFGAPDSADISAVLHLLQSTPQARPAAVAWSYSNCGYVVLAAVIEQVTGLAFATALQREVLDPLRDSTTRIIGGGSPRAVGHSASGSSGLSAEIPGRFPAFAAAGSTPVSTPAALLRLVYPHLNGGMSLDGEPFLSSGSIAEMQRAHAAPPIDAERKVAWGLGWGHYRLQDGTTVLGHGGSTFGFVSYLVVAPDHGLAIAIMVNAESGIPPMRELGDALLRHTLGTGLYT